ncbi:hypothetical protein [Methanogenium organophilum]|uniref:Uncharacterized protein n=1 Tax=Methanogenium organophilum TaxID=2199 RepID=A0A9X9S837_METOG|nr:hypothetical protein [Methanogenium organophilum]WAI02495.1 hypothetical protein OU421_06365 [Methanogenium organophilum]
MPGIFSRIRRWASGDSRTGERTYQPKIDCIVDTASGACRTTTPSWEVRPEFHENLFRVRTFWRKAAVARDKEALISLLAGHVREYPQESLRLMMVNFERKTGDFLLPGA